MIGGFSIGLPVYTALGLAFALGLSYGFGPCLLRCMPLILPAFLTDKHSKTTVLYPMMFGRLLIYVLYGILSASAGKWITEAISPQIAAAVLGAGCVLAGGILLHRTRQKACMCSPSALSLGSLYGGAVLQGIALTLIPCTPFAAVLFYSAVECSPILGGLLGLSFGLGSAVLPMWGMGILLLRLSDGIRTGLETWQRPVAMVSATSLCLFGLYSIFSSL